MKSQHKWLWWLASPFILIVAWYIFVQLINPLPSDEKMIAHFQAHKDTFEILVKKYQAYIPTKENPIFKIPENKALMKKAAIRAVSEKGFGNWYPNPYSVESVKYFESLRKKAGANAIYFSHPYRSIGFTIENPPLTGLYRAVLLFSGLQTVMKDFMYFPEVPKIENGRLYRPIETNGQLRWSYRAFSSLNYYPFGWEVGECVYRQIEPHWFICMCITY